MTDRNPYESPQTNEKPPTKWTDQQIDHAAQGMAFLVLLLVGIALAGFATWLG